MAQQAPEASRRLTILIVEDNVALAEVHAMRLRLDGFQVTTVTTAPEGLAEALRSPPDVIFLDVWLKVGNGLDLLAELRRYAPTRDVPTLILSSDDDPDLIRRAAALGARDYLIKSVGPLSLISAAATRWAGKGAPGGLTMRPAQ